MKNRETKAEDIKPKIKLLISPEDKLNNENSLFNTDHRMLFIKGVIKQLIDKIKKTLM